MSALHCLLRMLEKGGEEGGDAREIVHRTHKITHRCVKKNKKIKYKINI
jgi:hypothetical protein